VPGYTIGGRPDGVLKNIFGATTHEELQQLEADYVHRRLVELRLKGFQGEFNAEHMKAIHRHLFQDVYEWAGHTRAEPVTLSDGSVATEPVMHKHGGKNFQAGPRIAGALDAVAKNIRAADHFRRLPRQDFAVRAADALAEINDIHPFREGNGRTQRVFMEQLARQAGHTLDFSVVSRERMIQVSIAANEHGDPSMMRRLFDEISNPKRVEALRKTIESLKEYEFDWNDRYIATVEPGHRVELTMAGVAGEHFMARTRMEIIVGLAADLPRPWPATGESFAFEASRRCWDTNRLHQREERRGAKKEIEGE
jgi:cell filamentation protein